MDAYHTKAEQIETQKRGFERQLAPLDSSRSVKTSQLETLLQQASSARIRFADATVQETRELLSTLLLNAQVKQGEIASYQLESPFEYLRRDPKGAFVYPWWAIVDKVVTHVLLNAA